MTNVCMPKAMGLLWALVLAFNTMHAQYPRKTGNKVMQYTFVGEGGTDATAVVWVPGPNMYVTVMSGDPNYPMEGFSARCHNLWTTEAGADIRGLWYNPKLKRLEGNSLGSEGWFGQVLDENGETVGSFNRYLAGRNQPDDETVLSSTGKAVLGLKNESVYYYSPKNGKFKHSYALQHPEDDTWELNSNTIAYTGVEAFPLAALDVDAGGIVFFSLHGEFLFYTKLTNDVKQEDGTILSTPVILPAMNRFSFANEFAWIFDDETRTWMAFKVFY